MKISRIQIKDSQQFRNFDIDLTYPKGHPFPNSPEKDIGDILKECS